MEYYADMTNRLFNMCAPVDAPVLFVFPYVSMRDAYKAWEMFGEKLKEKCIY